MENDGRYFLTISSGDGFKAEHPKEVYPFDWNGFTFFAHRLLGMGGWGVTELTTGRHIPALPASSPEDAQKEAIRCLESNGIEKMRQALEICAKYAKSTPDKIEKPR